MLVTSRRGRRTSRDCLSLDVLRTCFCLEVVWLALAAFSLPLSTASAAELRVRFTYDGDPPVPKPIDVDRDVERCGNAGLVDERLLVNPETGGIQNVIVYVYTERGGTKLPKTPPRNQDEVKLTAANCQFDPHIVIAQAGDVMVFEPGSSAGHNLNINFFRNRMPTAIAPPGTPIRYSLDNPEPGPVPLQCNIHHWMRGYLMVLTHPYVGVSDVDGRIVIPHLPNNMELTFRVFHEAASGPFGNVSLNGKQTLWERNRFTVRTSNGVTDLGTVSLKSESFVQEIVQP